LFDTVRTLFFAEKTMTKQELIADFIGNHQVAIRYIDALDADRFHYRYQNKWTAGQQLEHILRTIVPFSGALVSKQFVEETFGKIDRATWDGATVLENYKKTSLQAPDRFLPKEQVLFEQKDALIADLHKQLTTIGDLLGNYTEEELDTLTLPHPLLGKLTIREMFYLMAYHPLHHQKQLEQLLETYNT